MATDNREYIGDGVYVFFNGFSYDISVGDHRNQPVVTMEDTVIDALVNFKKRMEEKIQYTYDPSKTIIDINKLQV